MRALRAELLGSQRGSGAQRGLETPGVVLRDQLARPARGMLEARRCDSIPARKRGDELLLHPCTWRPSEGAGGALPGPTQLGIEEDAAAERGSSRVTHQGLRRVGDPGAGRCFPRLWGCSEPLNPLLHTRNFQHAFPPCADAVLGCCFPRFKAIPEPARVPPAAAPGAAVGSRVCLQGVLEPGRRC